MPPLVKQAYENANRALLRNKYRPMFRNWARQHRGDRTLQDIADHLGVSRQCIHTTERGNVIPMEDTAVKWASALNINPLEFQMKAGAMPLHLVYTLAWEHFEKFTLFLGTLE